MFTLPHNEGERCCSEADLACDLWPEAHQDLDTGPGQGESAQGVHLRVASSMVPHNEGEVLL